MEKRQAKQSRLVIVLVILSVAFLAALVFAYLCRKTQSVLILSLLLAFVSFGIILYLVCTLHRSASKVLETLSNEPVDLLQTHSDASCDALAEAIRRSILASREQDYQVSLMEKQASLSALQSQINPHFLYNTLDCIRGEAMLRDQDEIADIINVLSSFFRYSISRKGDIVSVYEELQNVQNYYTIQQFRFSNLAPLRIEIDAQDKSILDALIPKLTLQPLVENAISYGLSGMLETGVITLSLNSTQHDLLIHCVDNGVGMSPEKLASISEFIRQDPQPNEERTYVRGTGIGLRNVNRRIGLLFGTPYGLTIYSTPGSGTDVVVRIPLKPRETEDAAYA